MGIGQTEQTEIWVFNRPNRTKNGYSPDRTDHFSYTFNRNTLTHERNRFVKLKLLPIFKTNVFDLYVHRQVKSGGNKLLKNKINIYLQLSETTLKTILGSILKNSINNFSLYTIFSLFTTVVNHRTNV